MSLIEQHFLFIKSQARAIAVQGIDLQTEKHLKKAKFLLIFLMPVKKVI